MRSKLATISFLAAMLMICAAAQLTHAAGAGVADNAHIFKPDTVTSADQIIQQIKSQQKHDVRVETYSAIPDDMKGHYSPDRKASFFTDWAEQIGKENSVSGVIILICMNPSHIQVAVGNQTRQHAFTMRDRDDVVGQLASAFKEKNYDAGILDALRTIQSRMTTNIGSLDAGANSNAGSNSGGGYSGGSSTPSPNPSTPTHGFHFGGLICLAIGVIVVLMIVSAIARRNRGYGYGAPPPAGGYPPGYMGGGGGYPPGYSGGGGGFGRGLLGGLLGGALGAWGYDRMTHGGSQASGGYVPPPTSGGAGSNDVDTSYSSSGADFGSSTPDSGGGADFGSSDSGGGGADFGGGGDSGGGGGDFGGGGGGDSGGGGDF